MNEVLEFESNTFGLWARLITKIFASFIVTFFIWLYFSSLILSRISLEYVLFILLAVLIVVTWFLLKENPLKWRNKVRFDFEKQTVQIYQSKHNTLASDVLDFKGNEYTFQEIKTYSTINYESFLFSPYYMTKIYVNKKEIKLLSLKSAEEFTSLTHILKDRLKLKIK